MSNTLRFPYKARGGSNGPVDQVPLLPFTLHRGQVSLTLEGLIDSGSVFSVLPFDIGARFGFSWDAEPGLVHLGGIARSPAKVVPFTANIGSITTTLSFAWARSNSYPILLGNADFFFNFDVFLCRRHSYFEIQPATP
jgi:hypothetical protein